MTATEEINEWVQKYGSERDALNVALAKLYQAETELAGREKDLENAQIQIEQLSGESEY